MDLKDLKIELYKIEKELKQNCDDILDILSTCLIKNCKVINYINRIWRAKYFI